MQRRAKAIRPRARAPNATPSAMPSVRSLGGLFDCSSVVSDGSASFGAVESVATGRLTS
jgi:hypothetical protein